MKLTLITRISGQLVMLWSWAERGLRLCLCGVKVRALDSIVMHVARASGLDVARRAVSRRLALGSGLPFQLQHQQWQPQKMCPSARRIPL